MTDKRRPTYDLSTFKDWALSSSFSVTGTATRTAAALGFTAEKMIDAIMTMKAEHFYKSMTSYNNHRTWQDVYHVPSEAGELYIKFRADVVTEFTLLSFKEKDND